MLSDDLRALEDYFKDCLEHRQQFTERGLRLFFNGLRQARRDAEELEGTATVPQKIAAEDINSGKVSILPVAGRSKPRRFRMPWRPDGGGAA